MPNVRNAFTGNLETCSFFFFFFRSLLATLSQPFCRCPNDNEFFVEKRKSSSTCSEQEMVSHATVNSQSSDCENKVQTWDYDILEVLGQGSAAKVLRARQDGRIV